MKTQEDTTISHYSENDNDELLLLNGLERLEYFNEKPEFKKSGLKQQLLKLFKKTHY